MPKALSEEGKRDEQDSRQSDVQLAKWVKKDGECRKKTWQKKENEYWRCVNGSSSGPVKPAHSKKTLP